MATLKVGQVWYSKKHKTGYFVFDFDGADVLLNHVDIELDVIYFTGVRVNRLGAEQQLNEHAELMTLQTWEELRAELSEVGKGETVANDETYGWRSVAESKPPEGMIVDTKISDGNSERNEQPLKRSGNLWFVPDGSMYVYYRPTHWKPQRYVGPDGI